LASVNRRALGDRYWELSALLARSGQLEGCKISLGVIEISGPVHTTS
jgi:hypothetical protein